MAISARLSAAREANKAGMAALRTGDSQAAVAAFRQAIELDPEAGALRHRDDPGMGVEPRGVLVGTGADCALVLTDERVSRHHVTVVAEAEMVRVAVLVAFA